MQESQIETEYPYVMGWRSMLFLIFIGVSLAIFMGYEAERNYSGLTINGIIELGQTGTKVFFWSMSLFMVLVALIGVFGVFERVRGKSRIAFTNEGVILPSAPWQSKENYFTFESVLELNMKQIGKINFLYVKTAKKTYLIAENRFSNSDEFKNSCSILTSKCNISH
ncbi:hypothetical protein EXT46_05725 [Pseudoalteromonas sp. CO325X]|uniref:hypothetical protein n=1 Tax=Pseudoalteromonas sp. CO325X TaxID=1777262 RepID=UPI001023CE85|nr:hypothetical protein [Pseudoalteromonas sp. CO325X]RZF82950.1 hypothetical protein EXT46_05725 [Pseudoalteromonas sp. CO325X]